MPTTESRTHAHRNFVSRLLSGVLAPILLLVAASRSEAQVRERPVAFDSAGRVMGITPPLAARLGLEPPLWPVAGDYLDARLYALDDSAANAVLVVHRQRDVLERYPLTAPRRRELASAVDRGFAAINPVTAGRMPAEVSEPVRGDYVLNQTLLGALVFGPLAASVAGNAAGGTAAYLALAGGTFFLAAERTKHGAVSRAQNHLAWHGALQGAGAALLATYAVAGEDADGKGAATAALIGGIAGDVIGDRLARPMTDAEAHGVSHGGLFVPSVAAGLLGTVGLWNNEGSARAAAVATLGAQVIGYPLGMRYVRGIRYHVTAGDVNTLIVGEAIGVSAAASLIGDGDPSAQAVSGLLTAGLVLGAVVADRGWVMPYDFTDSEGRLMQLGTLAGGVAALAIPVAAQTEDARPYFLAATAGGLLGAVLTQHLLEPSRASSTTAEVLRTGQRVAPKRVDVSFTPQSLLLAGSGMPGAYPILHLGF